MTTLEVRLKLLAALQSGPKTRTELSQRIPIWPGGEADQRIDPAIGSGLQASIITLGPPRPDQPALWQLTDSGRQALTWLMPTATAPEDVDALIAEATNNPKPTRKT